MCMSHCLGVSDADNSLRLHILACAVAFDTPSPGLPQPNMDRIRIRPFYEIIDFRDRSTLGKSVECISDAEIRVHNP